MPVEFAAATPTRKIHRCVYTDDYGRTPNDRFAGNGGLSIRRVSAIKRVLSFQVRANDTIPEDEWFGTRLITVPGLKVAQGEQEDHFAVEDVWHEKPMGYHTRLGNPGRRLPEGVWKNRDQRREIFNYCPDIMIIMPMKLERERCEGDNGEGKIAALPFDEYMV